MTIKTGLSKRFPNFFFFFFLKHASTPSEFKLCLPIHTETIKRCKYDSDPSVRTACAGLYNV